MFTRTIIAALALASAASAQLRVLAPGGPNLWWVANSQNTLIWNCRESQFENFTIVLTNTDVAVLSGPLAIIAIANNFDCSRSITTQQANLPVAGGYTVRLANPLNNTDVYAESDVFEVRAQGSPYPDPSSTPTAGGSSTGTGSGTGAGTGTATQTGDQSQDTNAAVASALNVGGVVAGVVGLVAGVVGML